MRTGTCWCWWCAESRRNKKYSTLLCLLSCNPRTVIIKSVFFRCCLITQWLNYVAKVFLCSHTVSLLVANLVLLVSAVIVCSYYLWCQRSQYIFFHINLEILKSFICALLQSTDRWCQPGVFHSNFSNLPHNTYLYIIIIIHI